MSVAKSLIKSSAPLIFVALDLADPTQAKNFVAKLAPTTCGIKIGKELFTSAGAELVRWCIDRGFKVFLDLKFHDIPNTVAKACSAAQQLGIYMLNVHILGGSSMLAAAKTALTNANTKINVNATTTPPKLLGVTLLTSLTNSDLSLLGISGTTQQVALRLAQLGFINGLDGVVCSAQEAAQLRAAFGKDFLLVTPGIRPANWPPDDQRRTMIPAEAVAAGSDHLVIGRPILSAAEPQRVIDDILLTI